MILYYLKLKFIIMKKLSVFFVMVTLFITACLKDIEQVKTQNARYDISNFSKLAESYKSKEFKLKSRLPKKLKILLADLKGAISGAQAGATIGRIFGGDDGAITGAITGAIVGAASASIEAAGMVINPQYNSELSINSLNRFDYIGLNHYLSINSTSLPENMNFTNEEFDFQKSYNALTQYSLDNGLITNEALTYFDAEAFENNVLLVRNSDEGETGLLAYMNNVEGEDYFTVNVKDILSIYFSTILNISSDDYSSIYQFSVDYENLVIGKSDLTESEKFALLSMMSTTRHGINYWGDL